MANEGSSYRDLLPVFEVLFDLLPRRVSCRVIFGISNSFCNNLMAILLGSLFDTLVLSIRVGLKDHLGFSVIQVRPFINSEVENGVFALICRPKPVPCSAFSAFLTTLSHGTAVRNFSSAFFEIP